jgi:surfeit locus 1 family protein
MTVLAILTIALCIQAGLWQFNKAVAKKSLQNQLNKHQNASPSALPDSIDNLESWRYKRVKFMGFYDKRYQLLLDNQVEKTKVGYHVFTPMQVEGTQYYVLINRGWVAAKPYKKGVKKHELPIISVPERLQEVEGDIMLPASKFFTLEAPPADNKNWQQVWQHLDLQRYSNLVPFTIQPFVVRLDTKNSGGFVRNWPAPGARSNMHLGYAYQWFGFAVTILGIFIVLNVKKVE